MISKNSEINNTCVLIRIGGFVKNTLCRLRRIKGVWGYAPTSKILKNPVRSFLIWCKWLAICVACYSTEMVISVDVF